MGNIVTVDFHGDQLLGFEEGRGVFVALKPIVKGMRLDWSGQLQRVKRDPILSQGVVMMPIPTGGGGEQDAVCLPLDLVHGWLFTVDASRIGDEAIRAKVITYQRECHRVLAQAFARPAPAPEPAPPPTDAVAQGEARKLVTEARYLFGDLAARQLWFRLGLPIVPAMTGATPQLGLFTYDAHPAAMGGRP